MTCEGNKKGCNNKILIHTWMLASMVFMLSVSNMLGTEDEIKLDEESDDNNEVNNTSFFSHDNNTRNEQENKIFNVPQPPNINYNYQQNITKNKNNKTVLTNKIIKRLECNLDFYKFLKKNGVKIKHKGYNCCCGPIDFEKTKIECLDVSARLTFYSSLKEYINSNYCAIVDDTRYIVLNSKERNLVFNNKDYDITDEFDSYISKAIRIKKHTAIKNEKKYKEDSPQYTVDIPYSYNYNSSNEYEMNNKKKNYELSDIDEMNDINISKNSNQSYA